MTRFVNPDFPTEHPGVIRAEAAVANARRLPGLVASAWHEAKGSISSTRGMTTMLLAAAVAALVLLADQLVDTWADDHLLMAWVALWTLIFATLAVFAPVIKRQLDVASAEWTAWRQNVAAAESEKAFLTSAYNDPRVMEDLRAAILRHEAAHFETHGVAMEPIEVPAPTFNVRPMALGHWRYL